LVSVCIPTYNGEKYLGEALDSVLAQTYRPLEIIISDDNSTDRSLDIVHEFEQKTDIPFYIHHHKPKGIGANWNNCVKHAHGEYIKFLFQDDILLPACIEKMMLLAQEDVEIGLVFCKRDAISENEDERYFDWQKRSGNLHKYFSSEINRIQKGIVLLKDDNFISLPENKIGEPTNVLLNINVFKAVGFFRLDLKQILDAEFWYRIAKDFKIGFINETLVHFRLHEMQASKVNARNKHSDKRLYEKILLDEYFAYLNLKNKFKILLYYFILNHNLRKRTITVIKNSIPKKYRERAKKHYKKKW